MKLGFTLLKSLEEGLYQVVITGVKLWLPKKVAGQVTYVESDKELTEELLNNMIAKKEGYLDIVFTTKTDPARKDSIRIWPQRLVWTLVQLADKAGIEELEDTKDLIDKPIELYYSHSYTVNTKQLDGTYKSKKVLNKQWQLYAPTTDDEIAPTDENIDL